MAYSAIGDAEISVNQPITVSLMFRMRDNPEAIFAQLGWKITASRSISGENAVTVSSLITFNHGLTDITNVFEIDINVYLICKTTEHNYAVDDVVVLNPAGDENDFNSSFSATITTSQVQLRLGNAALVIRNKTTGARATITPVNWSMIIKARA